MTWALLGMALGVAFWAATWVFHLRVQCRRLEACVGFLKKQVGPGPVDFSARLDKLAADHKSLVRLLSTTATPTRVEFLDLQDAVDNLQDAVDNLVKADKSSTSLHLMHAAALSHLQTELAKMRLDPYYGYKGKEN